MASRLRWLVTGPTVDAVTFSRNASRYWAVVHPCALLKWLPPTILYQPPHRWHCTRSPSERISPIGAKYDSPLAS
jgi:hypothetical protein